AAAAAPAALLVGGGMAPSGEAWIWLTETATSTGVHSGGLFHRAPGGHFVFDPGATTALADLLQPVSQAGSAIRVRQDGNGRVYGLLVSPGQAARTATAPGSPGGAAVSVKTHLGYGILEDGAWTEHAATLPATYTAQDGDTATLAAADVNAPGAGWGALTLDRSAAVGRLPLMLGSFKGADWTFVRTHFDALDLNGGFDTQGAAVRPLGLYAA